jgi:hypothetical protein
VLLLNDCLLFQAFISLLIQSGKFWIHHHNLGSCRPFIAPVSYTVQIQLVSVFTKEKADYKKFMTYNTFSFHKNGWL